MRGQGGTAVDVQRPCPIRNRRQTGRPSTRRCRRSSRLSDPPARWAGQADETVAASPPPLDAGIRCLRLRVVLRRVPPLQRRAVRQPAAGGRPRLSQDDLIALGRAAGLCGPGFATCLAEMVEVRWPSPSHCLRQAGRRRDAPSRRNSGLGWVSLSRAGFHGDRVLWFR